MKIAIGVGVTAIAVGAVVVIRRRMMATAEMNAIAGGNAGRANPAMDRGNANPQKAAPESRPVAGVRLALVRGEFDRFNIRRPQPANDVQPQVVSGDQNADTDSNTSGPRGPVGFIPFIHTRRGGATVRVGPNGAEVSYGTDDSVPGAVESRGFGGGR
jgi:hypothetical protein